MTRRESEPTQLEERGVSIIRLSLPPTIEYLLWVVMAFCTIQRRRQASAPICLTSPRTSSPAIMRRRVVFPQARRTCNVVKLPLSMMSEKSLMTSFPERLLKCEINICPYKTSFQIVLRNASRRYVAGVTPLQKVNGDRRLDGNLRPRRIF